MNDPSSSTGAGIVDDMEFAVLVWHSRTCIRSRLNPRSVDSSKIDHMESVLACATYPSVQALFESFDFRSSGGIHALTLDLKMRM